MHTKCSCLLNLEAPRREENEIKEKQSRKVNNDIKFRAGAVAHQAAGTTP